MHRLLKRQLKKIGYNDDECVTKEQFEKFINFVDLAYKDGDEDREFLEHTLEVSSKEMKELYQELEKKSRTKLAKSEARFKSLARHDSLTGISNRFALEEELKALISASKRYKLKFALLFMDLDHFKTINDTYGHDFGDKLLQEVVARVLPELRAEDIFARLGGDEFVIVFTNIEEISLSMMVERIINLFRKPWYINEIELNISTSMGIVIYPKDGENEIDLLKHADIAMYKAKEQGRDKFSFFTNELNQKVLHDMKLEEDLYKAIENKEFELFYQPKVDVQTNKIVGCEALIRWRHPEFGLVYPLEFIPLAESNGMIQKIGAWVIFEAAEAIKRFNKFDTKKQLHVSVNVSLKQLQDQKIFKIFQKALVGINKEQLVLEVTESIMAEDVELAIEMLNKIRKLGVRISMDDFGTGYSSLSYLNKLPIDSLKIDKAFVDEIPKDTQEKKILIDTIIVMARTLDMCVVAEGVEEEYQLEYLRERDCMFYQGYLFSKPVCEEEYLGLIKSLDLSACK